MRYKVKKDGNRYAVYDSVLKTSVKWFDFKDSATDWRNNLEQMIEKGKLYGSGIYSYRQFVSSEMKKRPKDVKVTEYMKVIAKKWHSTKKQGGALGPLELFLSIIDIDCYMKTLEDSINNASNLNLVVPGDYEKTLENLAEYSVDKVIECVRLPKIISRSVLRPLLKADIIGKLRLYNKIGKLVNK